MIMSEVIARLGSEIPKRTLRSVSGALDLSRIKQAPQAPCAFILPLAEDARPNTLATGALSQRTAERFAVILALKSVNDRSGAKAEADIRAIREAVVSALLGWEPTPEHDPVEYARGRLLDLTGGLVWWQDEFTTASYLRR